MTPMVLVLVLLLLSPALLGLAVVYRQTHLSTDQAIASFALTHGAAITDLPSDLQPPSDLWG